MFISTKDTAYGRSCQPHSVDVLQYLQRMTKKDSKQVLWENVSRLMVKRYGKENLTRLAADSGVGPGTCTRIKVQSTSVGLEVVEAIAKALEAEPWQMLVPNLDPNKLPSLGGDSGQWPMPMVSKESFLSLPLDDRLFIQGYLHRMIEEKSASTGNRMAA